MKPKTITTEYLTLLKLFFLTLGITYIATGNLWGKINLDADLSDTYMVIQIISIIPLFLLIATLVYLIREGIAGYRRRTPNLIMIAVNLALVIDLYSISQIINRMPGQAQSAHRHFYSHPNTIDTHFNFIPVAQQALPIMAIIFMLILVITSILTGKNWNVINNEQPIS
ncbi:MAG: hypothetical protein AAGC65_19365 [Mucilaginibacter sp.]|uniref:hypothetical protein n=1 Tax=Mucilaginibacter sp. TaxID=1882438 RepID=UPI0031ADB5FD